MFSRRPETSFLWFTSPWKTFKYIVWKNYKWYFIGGLLILLLIVFIVLFIYSVPVSAGEPNRLLNSPNLVDIGLYRLLHSLSQVDERLYGLLHSPSLGGAVGLYILLHNPPSGHYWDIYPCPPSLSKVSATHLWAHIMEGISTVFQRPLTVHLHSLIFVQNLPSLMIWLALSLIRVNEHYKELSLSGLLVPLNLKCYLFYSCIFFAALMKEFYSFHLDSILQEFLFLYLN